MRTTLFLSCLAQSFALSAVASFAQAQAQKVIFAGDGFTYNWQQSAAFKANPNWVGAALASGWPIEVSAHVAAGFPAILNQHPAMVFLDTGSSDTFVQFDSSPYGVEWESSASAIIQMVQMAKRANVKIILGTNFGGDFYNGWLATFAKAEGVPLVNLASALLNACSPPYSGFDSPSVCISLLLPPDQSPEVRVPTDAGYQVITQLAQTAIATYSLTIRGGYLSDKVTNPISGDYAQVNQVNSVLSGAQIQFVPQATWSDGVTRPMWNAPPYNGNGIPIGTWWSSNPKVMDITANGLAYAYTSGTATIWFTSATGQTFAPWGMTVRGWFQDLGVTEPVY